MTTPADVDNLKHRITVEAVNSEIDRMLAGEIIRKLDALAAALSDATHRAEAAEERATRAELEADNWSRDYRALEKAVCGDTGLSAMLIATQAMLFKPRAEAAEARVAELTAKMQAVSDPDFLFNAMDDVHDMDSTVTDYANAASKAMRALIGGE